MRVVDAVSDGDTGVGRAVGIAATGVREAAFRGDADSCRVMLQRSHWVPVWKEDWLQLHLLSIDKS